jgi:hypothetical protein
MRGMHVPVWLTLMCAALVIVWGGYRVKLGLRSKEAEAKAAEKRGLFGLPRRTHLLLGLVYVLLGLGLVAISFGWNPLNFGSGSGPGPSEPGLPSGSPGAVPVDVR